MFYGDFMVTSHDATRCSGDPVTTQMVQTH